MMQKKRSYMLKSYLQRRREGGSECWTSRVVSDRFIGGSPF